MKTPLKVRVIEFFIGNARNKFTSLVLAVVVWAFAFGNTGHETVIEGEISVIPLSDNQVVVKQEIAQTRFARIDGLEGKLGLIDGVRSMEIRMTTHW